MSPSGVLHWSDEIYRIFEIDPVRFGASYAAFLERDHPDDREVNQRLLPDRCEPGSPTGIRHRLRMADGRIKHVLKGAIPTSTRPAPLRSVGTGT